jgi:GNAT superfamily N-acetyltransferase
MDLDSARSPFVAGPEHAEVVGRLLHDFNVEFEAPTPSADELAHRFASLLGREDQLALVSGSADEPTGFAYLTLRGTPYYDGPVALLEELYVVPALRDQGIGTALLTTAIELVRSRGAQELQINVDEVDVDTRRFYERHGFVNEREDGRMLFYEQVWDLG